MSPPDVIGEPEQYSKDSTPSDSTIQEQQSGSDATTTDNNLGQTEYDPQQELQEIAERLYHGDFVSIRRDEYTQYLASTDRENAKVRKLYMNMFKWDANLLKSVRMLCDKLYFKGESQEIDRLLKSFSQAYVRQHPSNVFGDDDKVYIICYSLILLNTALHNKVNVKTSRDDFIKNSIRTYNDGNKHYSIRQNILLEKELTRYYDDLNRNELQLKTHRSNEERHGNGAVSPSQGGRNSFTRDRVTSYDSEFRRRGSVPNNFPRLDRRDSFASTVTAGSIFTDFNLDTIPDNEAIGFTKALMDKSQLRQNLSRSTTNNSTVRNAPSLHHWRSGNRLNNLYHAQSMSVLNKNQNSGIANSDNFDYDFKLLQDKCDLELEIKGPPYIKEGLLKYKVMNEETGFLKLKFGNTKLEENFMVVSKGELRVYSFQDKVIKKFTKIQNKFEKPTKPGSQFSLHSLSRRASNVSFNAGPSVEDIGQEIDESSVGDGNWLKNALNLGNYNLCSTFSQTLEQPPAGIASSSKNSCFWTLTFPKTKNAAPKQFLFEAGTKEVANEFVSSCNFWASRITAIPTEELISSLEYGWSSNLLKKPDNFKKAKINKWLKNPGGVYLTHYSIYDQFIKSIEYYQTLETTLKHHIVIKAQLLETFKRFRYTTNYKTALNNYESKLIYLQSEVAKYKSYIMILAHGLELRFQEKKQAKHNVGTDTILEVSSLDEYDDEEEFHEEISVDPKTVELIQAQIQDVVRNLRSGKEVVFASQFQSISPPQVSPGVISGPKGLELSPGSNNLHSIMRVASIDALGEISIGNIGAKEVSTNTSTTTNSTSTETTIATSVDEPLGEVKLVSVENGLRQHLKNSLGVVTTCETTDTDEEIVELTFENAQTDKLVIV